MPLPEQTIRSGPSRRYLEEQLAGLTPAQLLVKIYDAGIAGCCQQNRERVSRALVELIGSLNFEYRETSVGFFRLYNYCLRETKAGNFDGVKKILCELRDAWNQAEKSDEAHSPQLSGAHVA